MSAPHIDAAVEPRLDWLALTDAIAEGHQRPKGEIADSFLYRGKDTVLSRAAWIDGLGILVKTATVFPGNPERGQSVINGAVSLLDDGDGRLTATMDFHLLTKWKTAADSLLAARRLARPESRQILICGAGTVARSLIAAYGAAFPEARFAIWNRSPDRAARLASDTGAAHVTDLEAAMAEADIICGATMAVAPWLRGDWLRPGQHVDLIGAYRPDMREADDVALTRARVFVDSYDTTLGHIGELKIPLEAGTISADHVQADYYALDRFTRAPEDITLFKNGGGAHLDLMTARYIQSRAKVP